MNKENNNQLIRINPAEFILEFEKRIEEKINENNSHSELNQPIIINDK